MSAAARAASLPPERPPRGPARPHHRHRSSATCARSGSDAGDRVVVFDEHGAEHEVRLERVGAREAEGVVARDPPPGARVAARPGARARAAEGRARWTSSSRRRPSSACSASRPFARRHARRSRARAPSAGDASRSPPRSSRGRTRGADGRRARATRGPGRARRGPGSASSPGRASAQRRSPRSPARADAVDRRRRPRGRLRRRRGRRTRARHGFATVALAPRVLRAETAALVAAALCQHRWGDARPSVSRPTPSASIRARWRAPLRILYVMDPLARVLVDKDTTFAFMLEGAAARPRAVPLRHRGSVRRARRAARPRPPRRGRARRGALPRSARSARAPLDVVRRRLHAQGPALRHGLLLRDPRARAGRPARHARRERPARAPRGEREALRAPLPRA